MNIITLIPARGGSKSIPLKNIKELNGRPLIDYSIKYSLACSLVNQTIVSTDSSQIAEIAESCGALVPFLRPENLAQDLTPDFPVILHALKSLEKIFGKQIDLIIILRPTSPLRPPGLIEKAIKLMNDNPDACSLRSVAKSSEHPFRQWKLKDGFMIGYESKINEAYNKPRQELPNVYFQTGDLDIVRRETLLNGSVTGNNILPLVISHEEMVDIDFMSDWVKAEKRIKNS
jgi:CMP-N,N'-diacetyllegionaminic acid synthase